MWHAVESAVVDVWVIVGDRVLESDSAQGMSRVRVRSLTATTRRRSDALLGVAVLAQPRHEDLVEAHLILVAAHLRQGESAPGRIERAGENGEGGTHLALGPVEQVRVPHDAHLLVDVDRPALLLAHDVPQLLGQARAGEEEAAQGLGRAAEREERAERGVLADLRALRVNCLPRETGKAERREGRTRRRSSRGRLASWSTAGTRPWTAWCGLSASSLSDRSACATLHQLAVRSGGRGAR